MSCYLLNGTAAVSGADCLSVDVVVAFNLQLTITYGSFIDAFCSDSVDSPHDLPELRQRCSLGSPRSPNLPR